MELEEFDRCGRCGCTHDEICEECQREQELLEEEGTNTLKGCACAGVIMLWLVVLIILIALACLI